MATEFSADAQFNSLQVKSSEKPQLTEKFVVRFPPDLRRKIHQVANRCMRSVNKEILVRLEHSLMLFPSVPVFIENENEQQLMEKHSEFLEQASPESELVLNQKLKEVMSGLNFKQKASLLRFLQSLNTLS